MWQRLVRLLQISAWVVAFALILLSGITLWQFHSPVDALRNVGADAHQPRVLDRNGQPLSTQFGDALNRDDHRALHQIPLLMRQAFLASEDKRFFEHAGVDWAARIHALRQNLLAARKVRGASTITEQVVRILHPRPRTLWSRWLEGWEAMWLERYASKGEIFEFYLNQVPYAAQRRGVAQAARYYFDRDLATLTPKETLALAVLPRAPSAWDLYREPTHAEPAIARLAEIMAKNGELSTEQQASMLHQNFMLQPNHDLTDASHFLRYIRTQTNYLAGPDGQLHSTLDAGLQQRAQAILNTRLRALASKSAKNGAMLVADHRRGEILAYAIAGSGESAMENTPAAQIDAVLAPRQPGSTLKPFLYATALTKGWNAATLIEDAPLASAIGLGLHHFTNYSHSFYGSISLREALGNSLNIPALHTVRFVGVKPFLEVLHRVGLASLGRPEWVYDEGLALGNGEVSLFELTQAYATLANHGRTQNLHGLREAKEAPRSQTVFSPEVASLIGNILSDPWARRLEFGYGSVLNLPVQTAVKTGTSSDYRDAWAMGYDAHYVVGVWVGNLDRSPMQNLTGSTGPALALRSIFAELAKREPTAPLYLSAKLIPKEVCLPAPGTPREEAKTKPCFPRQEYFLPENQTTTLPGPTEAVPADQWRITRPTQGLQMAYDPRIPANAQAFAFTLSGLKKGETVEWLLNDKPLATSTESEYLWPVARGKWQLKARISTNGHALYLSKPVNFLVK